jgi:hypothetical protein
MFQTNAGKSTLFIELHFVDVLCGKFQPLNVCLFLSRRRSSPEQIILNTTTVVRPGEEERQRVEHVYQVWGQTVMSLYAKIGWDIS